ncbi:MAG: RlmE family RNA methyltransferase [Planctomycetes bacterium]|nr:RlmE family RNA methyltransferase [Planctomycetota bacterium]
MAQRQLHDRYFRQAKAEGYLARSAYKLIEINERKRLIRRGDAVLDLGCAPGSWLQVAAELVGPRGVVVGIDLKAVVAEMAANVSTIVGDINAVSAEDLLASARRGDPPRPESARRADPPMPESARRADPPRPESARRADVPAEEAGRGFQVVLSDMAPNTTGAGDDFVSERLCRRVLELLPGVLKPGGNLVMKVLEGSGYPGLLGDTSAMFTACKGFKPRASRDASREIYIVGRGYRG